MMPENVALLCMIQLFFMFLLMIISKFHQDEQMNDHAFTVWLLISMLSVPVITFMSYDYGLHKGLAKITMEKRNE